MCETLLTGSGQGVEKAVAETVRTNEVTNDGKVLWHCII